MIETIIPQVEISFDVMAIITAVLISLYTFHKMVGLPVYNFGKKVIKGVDRIAIIEEKVDSALQEVKTNGGGSLKDMVIDIREKVTVMDEKQKIFLMDESQGIFETDKRGEFIYVNRTLCRKLEASEREILGHGWINFLVSREMVIPKWRESIVNEIEFWTLAEFRSSGGDEFTCAISAKPINTPNPNKKLVGYIGAISETVK